MSHAVFRAVVRVFSRDTRSVCRHLPDVLNCPGASVIGAGQPRSSRAVRAGTAMLQAQVYRRKQAELHCGCLNDAAGHVWL